MEWFLGCLVCAIEFRFHVANWIPLAEANGGAGPAYTDRLNSRGCPVLVSAFFAFFADTGRGF